MSDKPQRIQRKRTKGWRMPEGAVYVGRPTRWGNPHKWSDYPTTWQNGDWEPTSVSVAERRRSAVVDFEAQIVYAIDLRGGYPSDEDIRAELGGKDLACWCPLDQPCHADVLLRIAAGGAA